MLTNTTLFSPRFNLRYRCKFPGEVRDKFVRNIYNSQFS